MVLREIVRDDENNQLILYCNADSFGDIQQELEKREIEIISSEFERIPLNFKQINDEQKNDLEKFLEMWKMMMMSKMFFMMWEFMIIPLFFQLNL
ncbi:MAG: hypothetical protein CM15mP102_20440 [Flavobacteriales bacterium]|nr:MAG: hypothetical protein CM15mP102_20440 [Flavobacteriales bacterium]